MPVSRFVQIVFPLALGLSATCGLAAGNEQDELCSKIAEFAAFSESGVTHAVVLRGGWGGETKDTIMTHDCRHSAYPPGKKLCKYLLPNSSWEFGVRNAERAAACLDSSDRQRFFDELKSDKSEAEITSSLQMLKDKQALVTLRFEQPSMAAKPPSSISVLTISTRRSASK